MGDRRFCYRCMEKYDLDQHICPHCGFDDTAPHNANYISPGTILKERYLVGALLEYNGEGATYIGHDLSTECKVLLREYMPINFCTRVKNKPTISVNYNNLAKYKAFMAEYTELNKSLARLRNNSSINPVLDMFADNNTTYTVFEYAEGQKMLDYLKDNAGELSWDQVSRLFPQLFTTVGILHNAGIIHRAISPETIIIDSKGELKLTGFCVSAVRTADAGLEFELYKGYAAPEQYSASSSSRQGTWTDVYALCAVLYRSLTGCMPVDSLDRIKNDDLCEPAMLNPSIPPHVSKTIMDGMVISGSDRIQTITELVTRLFEQPVASGKPVLQVPPSEEQNQQMFDEPAYQQMTPPPYNYPPPPVREQRYHRQEEEQESIIDKIKVPIVIGLLLVAILLIVVVFLWPVFSHGDTESESSSSRTTASSENSSEESGDSAAEGDTEVPNFIGKFYSTSEEKYKEFFKFDVEYIYDNDHESDLILEQDLDAGSLVPQGSTVKLTVSKGPEGADIPQYSGLTVSQYENALKKAGITNYTLVESGSTWGVPDTITQLQLDGKNVNPGVYFSNKEGKKLVVFYIPKDAQVVQPVETQQAAVTTASAVTTAVPQATAAVETQTPTNPPTPTQPPVIPTDPPVIEQPPVDETPPDNGENGEYGYSDEFGYW